MSVNGAASWNAILSSIFRVVAFIFLRVIPHSWGVILLPVLYLSYLTSIAYVPSYSTPQEHGGGKLDAKSSNLGPRDSPTRPSRLKAIVFSIPHPSWHLRVTNLALNTLLLLGAIDFTLRPLWDPAKDVVFARVGAVYPDAVKITVRYPELNSTDHLFRLLWRQQGREAWSEGPHVHLAEEDDWTGTVTLSQLWPSTDYEYTLAHPNKTLLPYPPKPLHFKTFPDPRLSTGSHFRFVTSSCQILNFPYMPFQGNTIKGYDLLADYLWKDSPTSCATKAQPISQLDTVPEDVEKTIGLVAGDNVTQNDVSSPSSSQWDRTVRNSSSPLEFMLFLGDFIYADVPIYFGGQAEDYRKMYRRVYASKSFRKVYEKLPILNVYDDHEIINNFAGLSNDSTVPYPNASSAYGLYNGNANYDPVKAGDSFYTFERGDSAFFMMDTRRYRSGLDEDLAARSMLGGKQLSALHEWLGKVNTTATFKFVVTSVPFTSLWGYEALYDTWRAYEVEKEALLNVLHTVPNVILLSGDRHEFAAVEFNSDQGYQVLEFSTSPLNMFYVPLFRTLENKSKATIKKAMTVVHDASTTPEERRETIEVEVPKERALKYIPDGNHKWSTFEVDTRDPEKPVLHLEVIVDGSVAYRLDVQGTPVKLRSATALSAFVPDTFKGMLDRIGLKPSKWF